jgi:hypothetical protein
MTQQEKEYYKQIRRRFENEQKIARAVKWIYLIVVGAGIRWIIVN